MNWIERIEKAVAYIEANLQDELTVDDVARAVFVSPAHLCVHCRCVKLGLTNPVSSISPVAGARFQILYLLNLPRAQRREHILV